MQTVDYNNTVTGILHMLFMLEKNEIDGFLITRPIYYYFARKIREEEKYRDIKAKMDSMALSKTEKNFRYDKMSTGMLVKHHKFYEYFGKYFKSNWLQIQGCYMVNLNYKDKKFKFSRPSLMIGLFYPFLGGVLGIIGGILLFGFIYEGRRRGFKKVSAQDQEQPS